MSRLAGDRVVQVHKNNIGLLRLVFASLVIFGHAPELIDGDRHREPLTLLFHTLSLGELSVDAFFLLSGFLITQSMVRSSSLWTYLERRVLRIYPAFVVAYGLSVFLLGPLVGAHPFADPLNTFGRMLTLREPVGYPGELKGLGYPFLNGSLWTIAYEFRCYLLVAFLGSVGLLRSKWAVLALTAATCAVAIGGTFAVERHALDALGAHRAVQWLITDPWSMIRLTAVFLIGSCAYLFKDQTIDRMSGWTALAMLAAGGLLLRSLHLAEIGLALCGGLALLWLALKCDLRRLQHINDEWDISYGVYLYGWPISICLIWFGRVRDPLPLALGSLALAVLAGAASWWGLEKWAKDLVSSRRSPSSSSEPTPAPALSSRSS